MVKVLYSKKRNKTHIGQNELKANPFCYSKRPCYREATCRYCLNRKVSFLCDQIASVVSEKSLCQFVTLTLPQYEDPRLGLRRLIQVRRRFHATIRKSGPYVTAASIGGVGLYTPHFHSLTGPITKEDIEVAMVREQGLIKFNVMVQKHSSNLVNSAKRRIGYMIKMNFRPTLSFKAKGMKILTASRGICVSRPTRQNRSRRYLWEI